MTAPYVVDLDDEAAREVALTGGKAAALARAESHGLATLGGVVLTTAFSDAVDGGADVASHPAVREAFERAGRRPSATWSPAARRWSRTRPSRRWPASSTR